MASFTDRMIGAARLDPATYEEVERDPNAMGQAMGVVVLSGVAQGVGNLAAGGVSGLVLGTVIGIVGWFLWALVTYLIGTKILPEPQTRANLGEMLRTTGFAASPGLLRIFSIIPVLGWIVGFAVAVWMLVAMVIAVRQALDYTTTMRAVGVVLIGWVIYLVVGTVMAMPYMMMGS